MNIYNIINRFKLMSGLSTAETNDLMEIINDCTAYITALAGESIDNSDYVPLFENAAAALSFYKYTLYLAGSGRLRDFSAGDFSLDGGSDTVQYALDVWQQALNEILPYSERKSEISAEAFAFTAT